MSSVITSILSSTVGLLWNKVRDTTAEKLKNGDVTDATIRKIVVRELDDVKTKLDGLSRRDLLSSYSFLKEGVALVNVALDRTKPKDEEKALLNEAQDDRSETSRMLSSIECDILNDGLELSEALTRVKIDSDKQFEAAKKRFKEARKTATQAFCNEALSIHDRIFAAKFRVVAEILECLDSPETATTGCLSFLQDLHSLPASRELFSVFLNGGMRSMFNKAERLQHVKSIMLINYVLYRAFFKFSNKYCSGLVWPTIKVVDDSFNPILDWRKVSSRIAIGEELLQPPNELKRSVLGDSSEKYAVNSHGEIFVAGNGIKDIEIIYKIKRTKVVKLPDPKKNESKGIAALAVDGKNHVYVLRLLRKRTENHGVIKSYVLYVLDENYKVKHCSALDFEAIVGFAETRIAVNKINDIIMINNNDPNVFIFDNSGHLKHKFERDSRYGLSLGISKNNEIMIPSSGNQHVHVYTEEGNLKSTIEVPGSFEINHVAFSHVISKIIILAFSIEELSYLLFVYSETDELESSTFVSNFKPPPFIISHPSGPVVIIKRGSITYI